MASATMTTMSATASSPARSPYIVSPVYDWCLFLLPPALSLLVGFLVSGSEISTREIDFHGWEATLASVGIGIIIHAHIFIVLFRSHANPSIFATHKARFVLVPILLWSAMVFSSWVLIACSVLATFWDVYHSGLQTFGFGRLYDRKVGNAADVGRTLDLGLNSLLYAGPIVGGATMMAHFEDFHDFESVGATFFTKVPAFMETYHSTFAYAVMGFGSLFTAYYVYAYFQLHKQGYTVSWQKTWLVASTGLTSIFAWGFNSFGEAFLIMNLFHAVQYFGLVWWSEKKNLVERFGLSQLRCGIPMTFAIFVGSAGAYGYFVEWLDADLTPLIATTLTISLMHFWYDGFIWSVRKKQV